jgi:hypothetical protein
MDKFDFFNRIKLDKFGNVLVILKPRIDPTKKGDNQYIDSKGT